MDRRLTGRGRRLAGLLAAAALGAAAVGAVGGLGVGQSLVGLRPLAQVAGPSAKVPSDNPAAKLPPRFLLSAPPAGYRLTDVDLIERDGERASAATYQLVAGNEAGTRTVVVSLVPAPPPGGAGGSTETGVAGDDRRAARSEQGAALAWTTPSGARVTVAVDGRDVTFEEVDAFASAVTVTGDPARPLVVEPLPPGYALRADGDPEPLLPVAAALLLYQGPPGDYLQVSLMRGGDPVASRPPGLRPVVIRGRDGWLGRTPAGSPELAVLWRERSGVTIRVHTVGLSEDGLLRAVEALHEVDARSWARTVGAVAIVR